MKTILFICIHNSGRSQMAEAFFNRMAEGKALGLSAGTQPGIDINPIVREAMEEIGIKMNGQKPKMLTQGLLNEAERVITMGCGVDPSCPVHFVAAEDWGLDDPAGQSLVEVRWIRDQVKQKVERLVKEIDNGEV